MMEKQIEEIRDVLDNVCTGVSIEQACTFKNCKECQAKALYNAGYRKVDEDLEQWDIRNYTKEELFQYLEENENCEVVEKSEVNKMIRAILVTGLKGFCIGDTYYFTKQKLNELISILTEVEEGE